MEEKNSYYKHIIKSNITSFLSYTILLGFIFSIIVILIKILLQNMINPFLSITLSLMCGILLFNMFHFISETSTISTFKDEKLDAYNAQKYLSKMNLFYTICIVLSVLICIGYLMINNFTYINAINSAYEQYSDISYEFAEKVVQNIKYNYDLIFPGKLYSTIIIELSLVLSFITLIPYQKKLLHKCNK